MRYPRIQVLGPICGGLSLHLTLLLSRVHLPLDPTSLIMHLVILPLEVNIKGIISQGLYNVTNGLKKRMVLLPLTSWVQKLVI